MIDDYVSIEFWDHSENCDPVEVEVVGKLTDESELAYKVHSWMHFDSDATNETYYWILKSTVTKFTTLCPSPLYVDQSHRI